jgi:uncharacterized membrane protein
MRFPTSIYVWQVLACLIGIVVCTIPCDVIHRGFWDYHHSVMVSDTKGVRIEEIQPNTPAAALQEKDRIVAINGREDAIYDIHGAWEQVPVGSDVEFRVLRGEPLFFDKKGLAPFGFPDVKTKEAEEVVVRIPRVADPVAGQIYWNWQLPVGLTLLALGVCVIGTCRFRVAAVYRGVLPLVGGLTLATVLLAVHWSFQFFTQRIAWIEHYSYANPFPWQKIAILALSGMLALLGGVDLLTRLTTFRRSADRKTAEPVVPLFPTSK